MKKTFPSLAVLVSMAVFTEVAQADLLELKVNVRSERAPSGVSVQEENGVSNISLTHKQGDRTFQTTMPRPTARELASAKLNVAPYRLVADWGQEKEQLFLGFHSLTPLQIQINIWHERTTLRPSELDAIEALGSDIDSTLQKYFRARAYHKGWRYELRQPTHQVAIRSARVWFDAAANLAQRRQSYFRMDEEVQRIMVEYEELAASDERFRNRYRRYANPGYVSATLNQVATAEYWFVGEIPRLVASGMLMEAQEVNSKALEVLESENPEIKRAVAVRQGVTVEMLKANSAYIMTKQGKQ